MKNRIMFFVVLTLSLSLSACTKNDPLDKISGVDQVLEAGKLKDSAIINDVTANIETPSEESLGKEEEKVNGLKTNVKINEQLFEQEENKNQSVPTVAPTIRPLTTVNKLMIQDLIKGEGEEATSGARLTVNYVGTLTNGVKFDSSLDRQQAFTFTLGKGEVIEGWDQGLVGMKEGGKRMLTIPAELAYGNQVRGNIPAGATLIFEIELIKVEKAEG